jgi:alkanesulfonate monooxygenase SsuD/methylene tetrahydromethanopterin reductase-like flavin-dependent oxidoreductase (luciferase family)
MDGIDIPRIGLRLSQPTSDTTPSGTIPSEAFEQLAAAVLAAEAGGFDAVWVHDGPALARPDGPGPDPSSLFAPYSLLGALAVRSTEVNLAVFPDGDTVRGPAMVTKLISAVDVISHGRAVLALGPPADDGTAAHRLAEELQICRALLAGDAPTFAGRYHQVAGAPNRPLPPDGHRVPLVVASDRSDLLSTAARWADALMTNGSPSQVATLVGRLDAECQAAGRSAGAVTVLWSGTVELVPSRGDRPAPAGSSVAPVGSPLPDAPVTLVGDTDRLRVDAASLVDAGVGGFVIHLAGGRHAESTDSMAHVGAILESALAGRTDRR